MPATHGQSIAQRCRRIATAAWSDALDQLGVSAVMDGLTIRSGGSRIAGPAMTVREQVGGVGSSRQQDFDVGRILATTGPRAVAVISMGGAAVSTFGGLAANAAVKVGVSGVVIDGGCRDIDAIRASSLYVASRHVTPRSGKTRVTVVEIGGEIVCGGVVVSAGDYIVADETGVVAIPSAVLAEALALAEALSEKDLYFLQEMDRGAEFGAVAAKLDHL